MNLKLIPRQFLFSDTLLLHLQTIYLRNYLLKIIQNMSLFSRVLKSSAVISKKKLWKPNFNYIRSFSVVNNFPLQFPRVQEQAPDFKGIAVYKQDFKEIKLSDYKGKYLIFFFYPLDFTFVCPTEIIAFSEQYEEFQKIDTEIVGCSCDSHFSHLAWINAPRKTGGIGEIRYPLLSDYTKIIARNYGVLIESSGVSLRGLFIIDPKGIIRHLSVNDLPVGRNVDECLRLVKAFKFNDEHGEVCPANWTPDSDSIKPNPKEAKQYFEKNN